LGTHADRESDRDGLLRPGADRCANLSSTRNPIAVQVPDRPAGANCHVEEPILNPLKTDPIISGGVAYAFTFDKSWCMY